MKWVLTVNDSLGPERAWRHLDLLHRKMEIERVCGGSDEQGSKAKSQSSGGSTHPWELRMVGREVVTT